MYIYRPSDIFAAARDEAEIDNFLNNDVYKFLMLDFILANPEYRDLEVERKMKIRSDDVKTALVIPKEALIEQLDAIKNLKWVSEADISYMRWMKWPTWQPLFSEETLSFLENFELPDYELWTDWNWNYELTFRWPWASSMMWEIFWLKIINSLYLYNYVKKEKLTNVEFNQIINETLHRLYEDIKIFKQNPWVTFSEFWTRRSASTDFQRIVFEILSWSLPGQCLWTSNVMISREFGQANPRWTNAHELRMILTALYDDPEKIVNTMYDVDRKWMKHFPWLWILLPDTYWTSFYFDNCPEDILKWHDWARFDSKNPNIAIPEYVNWLLENWQNPKEKMWIPSDWLWAWEAWDIFSKNQSSLWKLTFWIGTNLTNNTKWTWPRNEQKYWPFGSFSIVVKPSRVKRPDWTWMSCVKLSDNPTKATWEPERVKFFKQIFWDKWQEKKEVLV